MKMSPLDDNYIVDRILTKLDGIDSKIDDLCDRMTKTEVTLTSHLEISKEKAERKEKIFYAILAVIGGIVSIVEVFRSGIIG